MNTSTSFVVFLSKFKHTHNVKDNIFRKASSRLHLLNRGTPVGTQVKEIPTVFIHSCSFLLISCLVSPKTVFSHCKINQITDPC